MLAELIENGLAFSPPDVDVEIHGRMIGNSYLIAVSDQGIGMSVAEMDRANERLRGEGDFITAPARYLGHYVVGRLAVEMGIEVQLTPSPVTGVTARIGLPPEVVSPPQKAAPQSMPSRQTAEPARTAAPGRALAEYNNGRYDSNGRTDTMRLPLAAPVPPIVPTSVPREERLRPSGVEYVVVDGATPPTPPPNEVMSLHTFEPPAPADEEAERTSNGLRKRTPKARKSGTRAQPAPAPVEQSAPVSDSPDAVRTRLTAFRDGVQRGAETAGRP
jgi:hypothetical protein